MTIERVDIRSVAGLMPLIAGGTVHEGVVYLCGVTPDPVGDIKTQTAQVLQRIDGLLEQAGSHKSKLLSAQVWLSDRALFHEHNAVWNAWVDPANPPARACIEVGMWRPGMLIEIMAIAAR